MRRSFREFFTGTWAWFVYAVGTFTALSWVADRAHGGSFWMWFAIFMLCGAAFAFHRFHEIRQELAERRLEDRVITQQNTFERGSQPIFVTTPEDARRILSQSGVERAQAAEQPDAPEQARIRPS